MKPDGLRAQLVFSDKKEVCSEQGYGFYDMPVCSLCLELEW